MIRWSPVPEALVERSMDFGRRLAAHYASGGSPQSLARSGGRGTESNPLRLAQGKLGEVSVALYFDLDPAKVVKWSVDFPDGGSDLLLPGGIRADVKTTFPHYNLIWSKDVNDLYFQKDFDVIISVSMEEHDNSKCWLAGFVDKAVFFANKRIADGRTGPRLEPGTWWMPKRELDDVNALLPDSARAGMSA